MLKISIICLVQTYDIITIQALTKFLKELKTYECLDESKLKVIINKSIPISKVGEKEIIGGIAYYKDQDMSIMIELFDRTQIKYITIPFDMEAYIKYAEGVINCDINYKKYSKSFIQNLSKLANFVYPVSKTGISKGTKYQPPVVNQTFTSNMNNTLNQMKNNM